MKRRNCPFFDLGFWVVSVQCGFCWYFGFIRTASLLKTALCQVLFFVLSFVVAAVRVCLVFFFSLSLSLSLSLFFSLSFCF